MRGAAATAWVRSKSPAADCAVLASNPAGVFRGQRNISSGRTSRSRARGTGTRRRTPNPVPAGLASRSATRPCSLTNRTGASTRRATHSRPTYAMPRHVAYTRACTDHSSMFPVPLSIICPSLRCCCTRQLACRGFPAASAGDFESLGGTSTTRQQRALGVGFAIETTEDMELLRRG